MKLWLQRLLVTAILAGVAAAIVLAMQPRPVSVDLAVIDRGPLVVTVTDDGRTRIRERYLVSAPLNGRLVRIQHKPGAEVAAGETLLATIEPTDPALLDPRTMAEAEARVKAAEARLRQAKPRLESATVALQHAETELGRLLDLEKKKAGSPQALAKQHVLFRLAGKDYESAAFEIEIAGFELEVAKAALTRGSDDDDDADGWSFPVRSPISGRVLPRLSGECDRHERRRANYGSR